ncbi:MAG TPA: TolC family protein [Bryobacteraceae bacterium]|nr:TolC family protein [Bryobacteraceae bacterium]
MTIPKGAAVPFLVLLFTGRGFTQRAPPSPEGPWHAFAEQQIESDARHLREPRFSVDLDKTYSLPELIDMAESHNPETHIAWESARAQLAALGVARSELYPTLAAVALSRINRDEVMLGTRFYRPTVQGFEGTLDLSYTVFDFGARAGRIAAAKAQLLAANFAFNDTHRRIIYQVEQAYYRLLNTSGQEEAARASLTNAQRVQQDAEDRLKSGLATLPDVLEAQSATAQAEYDLQAVLGGEEIARGDLATALGTSATVSIHVQPLNQVPTPESMGDTVDQAINRAFEQRPDLMQQIAEIRSAKAKIKEARAAYYPTLTFDAGPSAQSLYGLQQTLPWAHTADLTGGVTLSLNWTVFDGGARKNRLAQVEANSRAAKAQVSATRDQIEDQIWTAYSNLKTALRQRQSAIALLEAATQSYAAALQSYNYGVRSLLDVTAAQRTLAQARSADVLARTQVLTAVADLAFQTGDAIQSGMRRPRP